MQAYYSSQPLWAEHTARWLKPATSIANIRIEQGFLPALQSSMTSRIPLYLIVVSIWPELGGWMHGHLLITLPAFAIFLTLLGWTAYKLYGRLDYGVAAIALYCALPGIYADSAGLGAPLPDNLSSLFICSAAFCLINALLRPHLGWTYAFAVLASLAALARVNGAVYLFVICFPIFIGIILNEYRRSGHLKRPFVILMSVTIVTAPVILYILSQMSVFRTYSANPMWGLKNPLNISVTAIFELLQVYIGRAFIMLGVLFVIMRFILTDVRIQLGRFRVRPIVLLGCLGLVVGAFVIGSILRPDLPSLRLSDMLLFEGTILIGSMVGILYSLELKRKRDNPTKYDARFTSVWLAIGWWITGFSAFLVVIGYSSDMTKEIINLAPPLLLVSLFLFRSIDDRMPLDWSPIVLGLIAFSFMMGSASGLINLREAQVTTSANQVLRQTQQDLSLILGSVPDAKTWVSYTNYDFGSTISLLIYIKFGKIVTDTWGIPNHEGGWKDPRARCAGMSMTECQEMLYERTGSEVDLVVVFKDWNTSPPGWMDAENFQLAAYLSRRIQSDPHWQWLADVECSYGGTLAVLKNTARLSE